MDYGINIVTPSVTIVDTINGTEIMKKLERCARTCYQSQDKAKESPDKFIAGIIKNGHESVLEHVSITVDIVTDRGVLAEIIRHRIASYSVESTRYCNYGKKGVTFVRPIEYTSPLDRVSQDIRFNRWTASCELSELEYKNLLEAGATPQEARSVLNHSLKCEMVVTMNIREWRHFFKLRCAKPAHPHMKEIAIPLLLHFKNEMPVLFSDISYDEEFYKTYQLALADVVKNPKTESDVITTEANISNDSSKSEDVNKSTCKCGKLTERVSTLESKLATTEKHLVDVETKLKSLPEWIFRDWNNPPQLIEAVPTPYICTPNDKRISDMLFSAAHGGDANNPNPISCESGVSKKEPSDTDVWIGLLDFIRTKCDKYGEGKI